MTKDNEEKGGSRRSILDDFAAKAEDEKKGGPAAEGAGADGDGEPTASAGGCDTHAIPAADDEDEPKFDAAATLVRKAEPVAPEADNGDGSEDKGADAEGRDDDARAEAEKDKMSALDSLLAQHGNRPAEASPAQRAEQPTIAMGAVEEEDGGGQAEAQDETFAPEPQPEKKGGAGRKAVIAIGIVAAMAVLVLIGTSLGTMAAQQAVQARNIESAQTSNSTSGTHEQSGDSNAQAAENATLAPAQSQEQAGQSATSNTVQAVCEHDWQPEAETVHHDAVTKEVTVPGSEYTETEYHTLCNTCNEQVDGKTAEHKAATGHAGFTRNVPVKVTKKNPDTTQTVEVEAAYDEKKWTKEKCSKCGAEREVGEHSEKVEQ